MANNNKTRTIILNALQFKLQSCIQKKGLYMSFFCVPYCSLMIIDSHHEKEIA